jgi:ABC-type glycerol-3-phosphate transport system substrate-binding protein
VLVFCSVLSVTVYAGGKPDTKEQDEMRIEIRVQGLDTRVIPIASSEETKIGRYIKDKFNIVFDYVLTETDPAAALRWLATDDLPDIVMTPWSDVTQQYIAADKFISLEPYLKDMPNFTRRFKETLPYWRASGNGTLYIWQTRVPRILDTDVSYECMDIAVRSDLVEKYGWKTVVSASDWIKFLETVTPGTKDIHGRPIAGIGGNFGEQWGLEGALPIMYEKADAYTAIGNSYYVFNYKTGQFEDYFKNLYVKEGFKFWNDLYHKNLLDPEAFTDTAETVIEKMKQGGLAAAWYICFAYADINTALIQAGHPEMQYITMPVQSDSMVAQGLKRQIRSETTRPNESFGITSKMKDPKRFLALLDWLASDEGQIIFRSGIQGEEWDLLNGVRTAKPPLLESITDAKLNDSIFMPPNGLVYFNMNADDGQPHDLRLTVENYEKYRTTDRQKEAYRKLGWGSETGWYLNGHSFFNATGLSGSISLNPQSDLAKIGLKMTEFRAKNTYPLIQSNNFEADYRAAVAEYDRLGGEAVFAEMNRLYREQSDKLESYRR